MGGHIPALAPDLIGYLKLLARKRDALVMGHQESDDKKYSVTVYESLAQFPSGDDKALVLIKKNGDILVGKDLLSKSELSVFFWLVFSSLRRYYPSTEDTDEAAWQYLIENYRSASRTEYNKFYAEFNDALIVYINEDNEETEFGAYIYRRSMGIYNLAQVKIMDMED